MPARAVGAAAYVSVERGVPVGEDGARLSRPVLQQRGRRSPPAPAIRQQPQLAKHRRHPCPSASRRFMADGNPVAWFQGRMEFGPRALGGRSIIGCPSAPGCRRPDQRADQVPRTLAPLLPVDARHRRPADAKVRPPEPVHDLHLRSERGVEGAACREVVHEDGTSRAQVLERRYNPRWYDLMLELEKPTGNGVSARTPRSTAAANR